MGNVVIKKVKTIDKFIEVTTTTESYGIICDYGLKVLKKFYNPISSKLSITESSAAIMLHDILNYDISIEDVEEQFGENVAKAVFKITFREEDIKLGGYEKLFDSRDYLFLKLILRMSHIYEAINSLDKDRFSQFIDEYNELRRKLLKVNSRLMILMNYESDLIKYGRNTFAGKPANTYRYENLILDA